MVNCKKKLPCSRFSVPYTSFFLNNLPPIFSDSLWFKVKIYFDWLIYFYFTGFWFNAFSRTFPCCCCYFSLVIDIKSTEKNCESYSFANAIKRICLKSFTKPFIRWVVTRTYFSLWTTLPLTFTLVFMLWKSSESSPC